MTSAFDPKKPGPPLTPEQLRILNFIRKLSHWLDQAFRIPGTRRRIGLDPLIGLIPGFGDILMVVLSLVIIGLGIRIGASPWTIARMMFHVAVEALMGLIPFFGDIFDAFWKANVRNRILLEQSLLTPHRGGKDKLIILGLLGSFFGLFLVFVWSAFWVAHAIYSWIAQSLPH